MDNILFALILLLLLALIVGLIKPKLIMFWSKKPHRLKIVGWWLLLTLIFAIIGSSFETDEVKIETAKEQIANRKYSSAISKLRGISKESEYFVSADSLLKIAEVLNEQVLDSLKKEQMIASGNPLGLEDSIIKSLVGNKVPYDKWNDWGIPQTLEGTDNQYWIVYLDSANISFVSNKSTDIIEFADLGANSASKYLNDKKAKRKEQLDALFSSWDGSHIKLTQAIKAAMNDPKSYEHVETVYWDMGDHLIVQTKYRGNNAFGGKILGMVKAKVNMNGDVIEVIDQQ